MRKLGDIQLFVKIVELEGLAIAGRELGISPASATARLSRLEAVYGVRLLNRTTRRIGLTEEGREFYHSCVHILSELDAAEEKLLTGRDQLNGVIKISATFDLGRQQIAPLVTEFSRKHPKVKIQLHYADQLVDLVGEGFDLAVRYGALKDSGMVARKLASNRRILCASPDYLDKYGTPQEPVDLVNHQCIALMRENISQTHWHFSKEENQSSVRIEPVLSSNDGSQLRLWALQGLGIALKSFWDIKTDIESGALLPILEDYQHDWESIQTDGRVGLFVVYPGKEYLPKRTRAFVDTLIAHFRE